MERGGRESGRGESERVRGEGRRERKEGKGSPLPWHELYREYTDLVESQLESFLASEGVSMDEVRNVAKSDGWTAAATCVDFIGGENADRDPTSGCCTTRRYESFLNLMCDFLHLNSMDGVDSDLLGGKLEDAPETGSESRGPAALEGGIA
eukprot:scaffold73953_cov32-Tisochrysis_lutea.AAC.1